MWMDWRVAFKNKQFTVHFIFSLIGLAAFAISLPYFFNFILLPKPGITLNDPVLNFFEPHDWSVAIFIFIYLSTLLSLAFNFRSPKTMLLGLQTYVVVNFMRMASLYLFTLEAPEGIIPLRDPFLTVFAYGKSIYVKDLFFSGHISTLFLLFLIEERKILKAFILFSTLSVTVLLAWQRVHYTLDMLAAVPITALVLRFFSWYDNYRQIFPSNHVGATL